MKIIITILVVLLSLGGGAYYAQDSGLYDFNQLKQYIPSQAKALLDIKDTEIVSVSSNELEEVEVQPLSIPESQQMFEGSSQQNTLFDNSNMQERQVLQDGYSSEGIYAPQESQQPMVPSPPPLEREGGNSMIVNPNSALLDTTGVKSDARLNTQQQLAMNTVNPAQVPVENKPLQLSSKVSNKVSNRIKVEALDASPEEVKMVKELNKIESKIVTLDNENEDLQAKYSLMLKANRELALKIRDIDIKIKTIDNKN